MDYSHFKPENKSLLKKYLIEDVFQSLKDKQTPNGYTLSQAINSGLVNQDSGIGVYAGDEESYKVFSELFDPIIEDYHGFGKNDKHSSSFDIDNLDIKNPDIKGKYVLSTRIRVGRNLKDFPLGAMISDKERNEVANKVKNTLSQLTGDLSGNYYSLKNMSDTVREEMINDHFLFKQGDRFMEASGLNRSWPEDRGIFHNHKKDFLVWVNEEDQLRIISMQKGADIKDVFTKLVNALEQLEKHLAFSYNNRLGYISSCPTNLGTAMRASVHISLPQLGGNKELLEEITAKRHLQIRGIHGEHSESKNAIFDISNKRRLGITEVDAVKDLYRGVVELIKAEESFS